MCGYRTCKRGGLSVFFLKMQETEISAPARSSFPICGQQGGIEERRKKLIIC